MSASVHVTLRVSHHLLSNIFKTLVHMIGPWCPKYSNHACIGRSSTGKSPNYFLRVTPTNCYSIWHVFWHYIWLLSGIFVVFCFALYLSYILTFYLAFWIYLPYILTFYLASFAAILSDISPFRSGSDYWHLELAVEVRQCPLISGARGSGACGSGGGGAGGGGGGRVRRKVIKPKDLQLAAGEKALDLPLQLPSPCERAGPRAEWLVGKMKPQTPGGGWIKTWKKSSLAGPSSRFVYYGLFSG